MTNEERRLALLRPPYRTRLLGALALGLSGGAVAWFFGVDVAHAVGVGAVIAAFGGCLSLVGDQPRVEWAPPAPPLRDGPRRDVVQLGWALHARAGVVAPEAVRRLRAVTAQVLDLHGLDLDDPAQRPAIEKAVGADLLKIIRRGTAETPKLTTYRSAIGALDRLADALPGPFMLEDSEAGRPPRDSVTRAIPEETTDVR